MQLLPYCLFNVAFMLALTLVDRYVLPAQNLSIDVTRQGHTFINIVVSFLLLSRVRNGMERYNRARDCLSHMYRESREIVQEACVLSADNADESAKEWRHEVAYRCLILLRTIAAVIDFPVKQKAAWEVPELNGFELDYVSRNLFVTNTGGGADQSLWTTSSSSSISSSGSSSTVRRWAHKQHDDAWEESLRVPVRLEYLLQTSLHSQRQRLQIPIQVSQETRLFTSLSGFMAGYFGMRKFLTTVRWLRCIYCWMNYIPSFKSTPSPNAPLVLLAHSVPADPNGSHIGILVCLYRPVCPVE